MTASPIPLHSDAHQQVQELLPWYCTGRIDAADRAKVEAHVIECAGCQAALRIEMRLSKEVAALPLELELGWLELHGRLQLHPSPWVRFRTMLTELWNGFGSGDYARWGVAAQACLLLLLVVLISPPDSRTNYRTLSTPDASRPGNVIVMFRHEVQESTLQQSLASAGARLVDGPTPAGAYVLFVEPEHRSAALGRLRANSAIVMAEPIDEGFEK